MFKLRRSPYLVYIIMFVLFLAGRILAPFISIYVRSLGLSVYETSIIAAVFAAGLLVFEPIWGILSDKGWKKRVLLIACLGRPVIYYSFLQVKDFLSASFVRFFEGSVGSAMGVSTRGLVESQSTKKGRAFGLWWAVAGLAGLIGPVLGGYLAGIEYNLLFYAGLILAVIGAGVAFLVVEPEIKPLKVEEEQRMMGYKAIIIASIIVIFPFFDMAVINNLLPLYVNESPVFAASEIEIGLIFTIMGIVSIPTQMLFGELSDRIGRKVLIISGLTLDCLVLVMLPFASHIFHIYLLGALFSVSRAAVSPPLMALMTENTSPSLRGKAFGFYGAGEDVGMLLGPIIVGYVYQTVSPGTAFHVSAAFMFFGIICTVILLRWLTPKPVETT
jgi:MFS family permease